MRHSFPDSCALTDVDLINLGIRINLRLQFLDWLLLSISKDDVILGILLLNSSLDLIDIHTFLGLPGSPILLWSSLGNGALLRSGSLLGSGLLCWCLLGERDDSLGGTVLSLIFRFLDGLIGLDTLLGSGLLSRSLLWGLWSCLGLSLPGWGLILVILTYEFFSRETENLEIVCGE